MGVKMNKIHYICAKLLKMENDERCQYQFLTPTHAHTGKYTCTCMCTHLYTTHIPIHATEQTLISLHLRKILITLRLIFIIFNFVCLYVC